MASTKKIKVEYELSQRNYMNTGDLGKHMENLHWNDYVWCVSEPSNSTQQTIGRNKRNKLAS